MSGAEKLGRGLDALLGALETERVGAEAKAIRTVAIEKLQPGPFQPRTRFSESSIRELADSITAHGIIQPIVVRAAGNGSYDIITGERRWRAAQLAAQREVPVIIRTVGDQDAMALALIENIQREDLNVTEVAQLLKRLIDEFALTHAEIAASVGLSRASVTNLIRLLSLTQPVFEMLAENQLEAGHAKVLLALTGEDQIDAARLVVKRSLSVRKTEALVKNWKSRPSPEPPETNTTQDTDIARLERKLSERLTAKVSIYDRKGKGHIKINYQSLEELEGVLERIG